jgi:recombination protein RecT
MASEMVVRPEKAALIALDAELARRRDVIESSAASMIDPDRMRGVVLSAFSRNPELWECDPVTVVRAVIEAAQVGLEPTGAIGGAHLVPRWNSKRRQKEAQLIFDYRGLATLARRSGEISRISAGAVRDKDDFAYQHGTEEWLRHVPFLDGDPGKYTHYYAVAHYRDGSSQFVVMSAAQIESIRQRHAPRNKGGDVVGPWVSDPEEMAKKTVLRNLSKLLPLTIEARTAIAFEDEQSRDQGPIKATVVDRSAQLRGRLQARLAAGTEAAETTETAATPEAAPEADAECGSVLGSEECALDAGHEGPHRSADDEAVWPVASLDAEMERMA